MLGTAAAPASAAAETAVRVVGPGGREASLGGAQLDGGPERPNYILRAKPGEAGQTVAVPGISIEALLERAKLNADEVGFLTVPRPNGTKLFLAGTDLEVGGFPEGPPRVWVENGTTTRFFRPVRGPDDVNAEDNIATASGEALVIGAHRGSLLDVSVTPRSASTQPGAAVQLTASASGQPIEEKVFFRWSFGDGSTAEGETVTHAFTGSGTYEVRVTAFTLDESEGESGPVDVVVGNPPASTQAGAAPTTRKSSKPAGPNGKGREGRGGNGSKQEAGNANGQDGTEESNGSSQSGGAAPSDSASPESDAGESAAASVPEAAPVPQASAGGGESTDPPLAAKPPTGESPPLAAGETVEGRLVANLLGPAAAAAAAAEGGPSQSEGSESAPGAVGAGGGTTIPVAALIVVALLAAGALLEWRGAQPRLR